MYSETTQKNSDWQSKPQVKKGNLGEMIVDGYLIERGYIPYSPAEIGSHAFDRLAVKDKKDIVIAEVKTKARLNKFNATGFNIEHYKDYKLISNKYNIPIFVFFVDEMLKRVYGNFLSELDKTIVDDLEYPNTNKIKGIILFSLKSMRFIKDLTDNEITELKRLSNRNYDYLI